MDVQLSKKFEFPGSKKQYSDSIKFDIDYMILDIKPDFKYQVLKNCEQQIDIIARFNIKVLKFDIAELDIHNICVYYLDKDNEENPIDIKPKFEGKNLEKLLIELPDTLYAGEKLRLKISYSCGLNGNKSYIKPRSGFHFIEDENSHAYQAWTQGETIESRYWFPCIDQPQTKYKREVRVTVPNNYTVISNGDPSYSEDNKKTWIWKEETLNPAYLTSVVIGEFDKKLETYTNIENEKVELKYYWPKRIPREDAMRSYSKTSEILKFFEYFLDTKYPYKKYSQVAVDEFEFGGMENTNATTLNENLLHDKTTSLDFHDDIRVIVHELAHQWFGDLVTCEDWQDIWLNEGFANYCEALYLDKEYIFNPNSTTTTDQSIRNEFFYKVFSVAQSYIGDAANFYQRAIVTNIYKHPDELLDGHAYAKAGSVLHMLRSMIKDDILFRKAISHYLEEHKFSNSETDDLRQIFEKITGLNLLQFFDQWLYRSGHPEIEIELSLNQSNELQIKIKQVQEGDPFFFSLEAKIVYKSGKEEIKTIEIVNKDQDYRYNLPAGEEQIDWISIDPEFKILKNIKNIAIINETSNFQLREFLKQQLLNGETVIEKIEAARELKKHYSEDILEVLKEIIKTPVFYGVGVEAANTIGAFKDDSDWTKTKKAYDMLKECLENGFSTLAPQVRQSIVSNIGRFQMEESIPKLKSILDNVNESYFVRSSAATSLALSSVKLNSKEKKLETISILKDRVNKSNSFRQVIAAGAINGLMQFYNDSDSNIIVDIGTFLIEKTSTKKTNNYYIQIAAINAIRKFVRTKNHLDNTDIIDLNRCVFNRLIELLDVKLLDNSRWQVKIRAATSLVDSDALGPIPDDKIFRTMNILISAIQYDVNGFVQKSIERSLYVLRDYLQKWVSNPPAIEFKRKVGARKKEERKISMELIELTQPERIIQEKILESIRTLELP
jgi:aminopeptidase N